MTMTFLISYSMLCATGKISMFYVKKVHFFQLTNGFFIIYWVIFKVMSYLESNAILI